MTQLRPDDDLRNQRDRVFYDGSCGVCHITVRFLLRRDRDGSRFRFAPLQGETFERCVPSEAREGLPDSLVILTPDGDVLSRADGILHLFRRLSWCWSWIGHIGRIVPRSIRNFFYDRFTAIRHRLVAAPEGACPLLPADLLARFDP